jgi:hypothetical protein
MKELHPDAQWFEPLGSCVGCNKPATGILRGHRNDNRGPYCRRCAERAIKLAHKRGNYLPDIAYKYKEQAQ